MAVSADTLRLGISEEMTAGIPSTTAYDLIRTTGEGLTYQVTTTQSDEMGGINRGVKDNILTGATVVGDINFEMSKHDALETLMSAVLGNDWNPAGTPVPPATWVDETHDWDKNRTFTIEKRFTLDDTPTYSYHAFAGCLADTMTISITPNEPITGTLGFVGNEMTTPAGEAGSAYNLAGTNPIMTAPLVTGIELLDSPGLDDVTGDPLGAPVPWMSDGCFTGLTLNFSNNARALACIGSLGTTENVLGRFEVVSTGTLYYTGDEPLDALIAQTEFGMRVTMADENGNAYQYIFPRLAFSSTTVLATGVNTDVMTEIAFQMLEYQGDDYALTCILKRTGALALSGATDAANGATGSTGSVSTTGSAGTLYAVVTESPTTPTAIQIAGGSDHTSTVAPWSGSQVVTGVGVQTLTPAPDGLTASTAYWTHYSHSDGGDDSIPVTAPGFTTTA